MFSSSLGWNINFFRILPHHLQFVTNDHTFLPIEEATSNYEHAGPKGQTRKLEEPVLPVLPVLPVFGEGLALLVKMSQKMEDNLNFAKEVLFRLSREEQVGPFF